MTIEQAVALLMMIGFFGAIYAFTRYIDPTKDDKKENQK